MDNQSRRVPIIDEIYSAYIKSADTASFILNVSRRYTSTTLERLVERGDRNSRRAAAVALGFIGDYESNAVVGRALVDRDRGVRLVAENAIRSLWCRAGTEDQRQMLKTILRLNHSHHFDEVVQRATKLIANAPWFAEVSNQRAIAFFSLQDYEASIRDCHQTLEVNPYHFGAATGMGYCYLQLNKPVSALECFRRALRLNPSLEDVRAHVVKLQRRLKENS